MLRWLERQDKLLGLGGTKHEISGTLHHTSSLDFVLFDAAELEVLEYLILKGSGQEFPKDKRVCLIDADPLLAIEYKPEIEEIDNDIPFDDDKPKRGKLQ
jgi:hypothetical protein